jgi:hypothetical protein
MYVARAVYLNNCNISTVLPQMNINPIILTKYLFLALIKHKYYEKKENNSILNSAKHAGYWGDDHNYHNHHHHLPFQY